MIRLAKTGADRLDGRERNGRAARDGESSAPDLDLRGAVKETLKGLCQSARLAKARGEKEKSDDCGDEKEEARREGAGGEAADGHGGRHDPEHG
jgi:hypothetical protein